MWIAPLFALLLGQATISLSFDEPAGKLEIGRIALGQGGLSAEPMWQDRAAEVRALRPKVIRLFVQEYFDLLPARGRYDFTKLDRSVALIRATGAAPLLSIDFKPRVLFPKIDQDVVEPTDWAEWEALIEALVRHYPEVGYWEVANEPDIGEDGGCPYRFQPESYTRYYQHTVAAVRRVNPRAKVGGPALASWTSPILPALLQFCAAGKAPLDFVSWHTYTSEPARIRGTIDGVKKLLARYPALNPETVLNEWNMSLMEPVRDPRFQPAFIVETAWQMVDAGLDLSCYYHIRDYQIDPAVFRGFFSPGGVAMMARWWNRMPQFDGLFDYQNTVRPSYFAFKLLSRLTGERRKMEIRGAPVHGFFTWDNEYRTYNLLLVNFSAEPVKAVIRTKQMPGKWLLRPMLLDAGTASNDENARLRPLDTRKLEAGKATVETTLEPWAVAFWYFEPR